MINRRYPIQSVLAERKLFANGGMVSPQQPMQMQQPPMPMQMQQPMQMQPPMQPPAQMQPPMQPQGIMASSQPLVDAIAADALNPQGGGTLSEDDGTLSMAQGGLASEQVMAQGFATGGVSVPLVQPGSRAERRMELGRAPEPFSDLTFGDQHLFSKQFNKAMDLRKGALQKITPYGIGPSLQSEVPPGDYGSVITRGIGRAYDYMTKSREEMTENDIRRAREAAQSVGFNSMDELNAERRRIESIPLDDWMLDAGSNAKTREYFLNPKNIPPGYPDVMVESPEDDTIPENFVVDPAVERAINRNIPPGEDTSEEINIARAVGADGLIRSKYPGMPDHVVDAVNRAMVAPGNEDKTLEEVVSLIAFPEDIEKYLAAVVPSVSETGGEIVADPDEDPYLDDLMGHTAADEAAYVAASRQPTEAPPDAGGQPAEREVDNAVKQVQDAFKDPDVPPDESKKLLKDYMDEFKKAMPEYKGMSEEEKGWALLEAGLRIMGGQSPDAIKNITDGLKGLGPQFAKDAKEKRAWNRQVDLSAAKYALESVAKDRVQEIALAAEGRKRPYELVALKAFDFEGRLIKKGQAFPGTEQQLRDGLLEKYPLTYAKTYIANAKSVAALAKQALGGRVSPESFTKVQAKYLDDLANFKSGVRMKAVLRESARLATSGGVLGGTALLKDYANKAMNALGVQMKDRTKFLQAYSSTAREDYSAKQKRLGTLMATQLLRESSKTLSDYDRKRVEELIGALTGTGESLWASENVLKDRLINLEMSIDEGIRGSSNSMLSAEETWRKEITKGGTSLGNILLRARQRGLGEITQLRGSPTARSYLLSDIYDRKTKKFKKGFRPGINK